MTARWSDNAKTDVAGMVNMPASAQTLQSLSLEDFKQRGVEKQRK